MADSELAVSTTRNATRDGHHASLKRRKIPVWQCKHNHGTREEARTCAQAELNRRQSLDDEEAVA